MQPEESTFPPERVEFSTLDGVVLRGLLFPTPKSGPGIIMSPGFNCLIQMLGLIDVAQSLQKAGINAFIYDPRSTGQSDGVPRNDIDPVKQVGDFSDAVTFFTNCPSVDPARIGLWGMSFSATVALCAAVLDRRVKLVIAVCPLVEYSYAPAKLPAVLAKCIQDRISQMKGNEPLYIPMLTDRGENPAGFGIGVDKERFGLIVSNNIDLAPSHVNRTTIQSYSRLIMWQPSKMWQHLDSTPVLFVVPENDQLCSAQDQLKHFERLPGPKEHHVIAAKGHMDILEGEQLSIIMDIHLKFSKTVFGDTDR